MEEDDMVDHNSFLEGIQVAENIGSSSKNMQAAEEVKLDNSSLILNDVIQDLGKP